MNEEYMKQLMDTVVQQRDHMAVQQGQITDLVNALKAKPGVANPVAVNVQPAPIPANVIRAEKVQKLSLNLRKSNRIKLFKADTDIQVYMRKFGEEIKTLKQMVGIDDDLY